MNTGDIIEHTNYGRGIILEEFTITYDESTDYYGDPHVVKCYQVYFFDTSDTFDYWNMVSAYNPYRLSPRQKSFAFTSQPMAVPVPCDSVKLYNV